MGSLRKYLVSSTYKVTGTAVIVAKSAAEAERIGRDGYPSGAEPQFDFSDPHSETLMRAELVPQGWSAADVQEGVSRELRPFRNADTHQPNEPLQGWFAFGTHVDIPGKLEFSEALDDDGMPRWERPAPGSSDPS